MNANTKIFGYEWEEIKRAQMGSPLGRRLPAKTGLPLATPSDWTLLEQHGETGLRRLGYHGVLDRLENTRRAFPSVVL